MFDYLNKFPLFGYKYFSQINLYKIHNLVVNKEYKSLQGKIILEESSIDMKKDKSHIQYLHLKEFYKN